MATKSHRHPENSSRRAWGSFVYTQDGEQKNIRFTRQGDEDRKGRKGGLGYLFGRHPECDVILPPSTMASSRHFVIYKEVECAEECVYLRDLSQFEIGEQLGSGNFASVFKTIERTSGMAYAVKVVKKSANFNIKLALSLEREIGTLMSIDHPSLLQIYKVFSEEKHHYVVTELARGGELFDRVKEKRRFSESEARFVFRQLLNGVKYLHDRGIVHRDLKLENILLMDEDSLIVKISDFGLANVIGEQQFLSTICGTPSYDDLAPPNLRIQVLQNRYTFPSPYWDDVTDEAVDMVQDLLVHEAEQRLNVDGALAHDDQGTIPEHSRTEIMPQVNALVKRLSSHHLYKLRERSRTRSLQSLHSEQSQQSQQSQHSQKSQSLCSIDEHTKDRESPRSSSPAPVEGDSDSAATIPVSNSDNDGENSNDDKGPGNEEISQRIAIQRNQKDEKDTDPLFGSSVETLVTVKPDDSPTADARAKKKRRL
ncbi:hypothetical protein BGX26_011503 [Mortierella sp. AD094]|nr:hypothetical protein BGX26_011503 [Mortierella sp. AD094]